MKDKLQKIDGVALRTAVAWSYPAIFALAATIATVVLSGLNAFYLLPLVMLFIFTAGNCCFWVWQAVTSTGNEQVSTGEQQQVQQPVDSSISNEQLQERKRFLEFLQVLYSNRRAGENTLKTAGFTRKEYQELYMPLLEQLGVVSKGTVPGAPKQKLMTLEQALAAVNKRFGGDYWGPVYAAFPQLRPSPIPVNVYTKPSSPSFLPTSQAQEEGYEEEILAN